MNELVLGVQFEPIPTYSLIRAKEVYDLFRDRYPLVEEQGPIPPQYETFGTPQPASPFQFQMMTKPDHPRFWFLTPDKHELVQFQVDRLLHNWRQVDGMADVPYPRFEAVFGKFQIELKELAAHFTRTDKQKLVVNQIEVSYINRIYSDDQQTLPLAADYFRFLALSAEIEGFDGALRQVVRGGDGKPKGRLHSTIRSSIDFAGRPMINLTLIFKGPPTDGRPQGALATISEAHDIIVRQFADITTEEAHRKWQMAH